MPISEAFNMDCMEGMKTFPDKFFDLAIVDPPYGNNTDVINVKNGRDHLAKRKSFIGFKNIAPQQNYFDELFRVSKKQIVWGGNFFGLIGGFICWNKNGTAFGEAELAWASFFNSVRVIEYTWNGMIQHNMSNKEDRIHPTQKPIGVYKMLLADYAKPGDKILDTHLGSQSSRIAAYKLGFDFWGYEIDADYFKQGCERFEKSIAMPLFDSVKVEQQKLL